MEDKYTFNYENKENDKVQEPALAYEKNQTELSSTRNSIEELREKFDRAVKQAELGQVLTHEEVKNRYKK